MTMTMTLTTDQGFNKISTTLTTLKINLHSIDQYVHEISMINNNNLDIQDYHTTIKAVMDNPKLLDQGTYNNSEGLSIDKKFSSIFEKFEIFLHENSRKMQNNSQKELHSELISINDPGSALFNFAFKNYVKVKREYTDLKSECFKQALTKLDEAFFQEVHHRYDLTIETAEKLVKFCNSNFQLPTIIDSSIEKNFAKIAENTPMFKVSDKGIEPVYRSTVVHLDYYQDGIYEYTFNKFFVKHEGYATHSGIAQVVPDASSDVRAKVDDQENSRHSDIDHHARLAAAAEFAFAFGKGEGEGVNALGQQGFDQHPQA